MNSYFVLFSLGFPGGASGKDPPTNAGNLSDMRWFPGSGRSPGGEGMATHSHILACRNPWTVEPGGLQSAGSHRVRQDWSCLAAAALGWRESVYYFTFWCPFCYFFFFLYMFLHTRRIQRKKSRNENLKRYLNVTFHCFSKCSERMLKILEK